MNILWPTYYIEKMFGSKSSKNEILSTIEEWESNQRKAMKKYARGQKSNVTEERVEQPELLGFGWNLKDWNTTFRELALFTETREHCDVPRQSGTLERWVSYQRELYKKFMAEKKSSITDDQIGELEDVGFD